MPQSLLARAGLRLVRLDDGRLKPRQGGGRDDELLERARQLARELLFAHVRVVALSAAFGAMVVGVAALLQFADHQAATVSAMDEAAQRELALPVARFARGPAVENRLNTVPSLTAHERCVRSSIRRAVKV